MKLHLKNFRIYEDRAFDLGSSGITLIAGKSGQGKSTILLAITFALYGTGTKLQTNGKKSCSVLLEMDGIKIFRSKCPNKVLVNDIYENETGESIIREKFGNNLVSYIPQNMSESFVHMTPMARLSFLEKFAFGDIDIVAIKSKIKDLIRTFTDAHNKSLGGLELLTNLLAESQKPAKIEFPLPGEKASKELIADHRSRLATIHQQQEESESSLAKMKIVLCARTHADMRIASLSHHIEEYTLRLNKSVANHSKITETPESLELVVDKLDAILFYKQYIIIKNKYDSDMEKISKIKSEEMSEMKRSLENLLAQRSAIHISSPPLDLLASLEKKLLLSKRRKDYIAYTTDLAKLDAMKSLERETMASQLSILEKKLCPDDLVGYIENTAELIAVMSEKQTIERKLSNLKVAPNPAEQLAKLKIEIDNANVVAEKQRAQRFVYKCPHCAKSARMVDNVLVVSEWSSEQVPTIPSAFIPGLAAQQEKLLAMREPYTRYISNMEDLTEQLNTQNARLEEFDSDGTTLDELREMLVQLKMDQVEQSVTSREIAKLNHRIVTNTYSDAVSIFEKGVNKLKLSLGVFNFIDDAESEDEDTLRQAIDSAKRDIYTINENTERYASLTQKIEAIQHNITNTIFSASVKILESELKHIDTIPVEIDADEEETRTSIHTIRTLLEKKQVYWDDIATSIKEIDATTQMILDINNEFLYIHGDTSSLQSDITTLEKTIDDCITNYKNQEILVSRLDEWARYAVEFKKWKGLKERFDKEKTDESLLRKKTEALLLLKDKVLETQSISISNLIDNINTHAQIFLDKFFTDNPISVKIVAFKEGKSGDKPCINLEIDYRGIEHDLSMLSGGEMSRVTLAFTLALSEIHNAPLIMLDESTASLDQECVGDVIEGIHDTFREKLVLLIAHQVVKGVFDTTIDL